MAATPKNILRRRLSFTGLPWLAAQTLIIFRYGRLDGDERYTCRYLRLGSFAHTLATEKVLLLVGGTALFLHENQSSLEIAR